MSFYTIYKSDGTAVTIPDSVIDTQYYSPNANGASKGLGIQQIGRFSVNYGQAVAQNFLQITENFAGTVMPADNIALQGQLWFKKNSGTDGVLYVRTSGSSTGGLANWQSVISANTTTGVAAHRGGEVPVVSPTGTPHNGDIRVVGTDINIYASGQWRGMSVGDFVSTSGDTMTGPLTLSGNPTANLHAATKQYVDNGFVSVAGATMTGQLTLSNAPTANLHAANKQYVDSVAGSAGAPFQTFTNGVDSPIPTSYAANKLSGFDAYASTDFPSSHWVGCSVIGAGNRAFQLAANWNTEEVAPSGLIFRTNDDTGTTTAWSPWSKIWNEGNLTSITLNGIVSGTVTLGSSSTPTITTTLNSISTPGDQGAPSIRWLNSPNTGIYLHSAATHTIGFTSNSTMCATLDQDGFICTGDVTAYSDERIKTDILPIKDALDLVQKLEGVTYVRKDTGRPGTGLIAQQVREVIPEVVKEGSDGVLSVAYGNLVGLLIEAIKEQQQQIAFLASEIIDLRRQ